MLFSDTRKEKASIKTFQVKFYSFMAAFSILKIVCIHGSETLKEVGATAVSIDTDQACFVKTSADCICL